MDILSDIHLTRQTQKDVVYETSESYDARIVTTKNVLSVEVFTPWILEIPRRYLHIGI